MLYAAPEQMAGAPASPASDIYAATATFYECLTGRPPFSGEADELLRQHRSEPVPLDQVPEPLRPLVAAGMAKDPGAGPPTRPPSSPTSRRRVRRPTAGTGRTRPVAPGRGGAAAGGAVAVGRAAHGPGHQRVPGAAAQACEAVAHQRGEGGDRGRHRDRGRGGRHGAGRLRRAAAHRSRTSGGGGAVRLAPASPARSATRGPRRLRQLSPHRRGPRRQGRAAITGARVVPRRSPPRRGPNPRRPAEPSTPATPPSVVPAPPTRPSRRRPPSHRRPPAPPVHTRGPGSAAR